MELLRRLAAVGAAVVVVLGNGAEPWHDCAAAHGRGGHGSVEAAATPVASGVGEHHTHLGGEPHVHGATESPDRVPVGDSNSPDGGAPHGAPECNCFGTCSVGGVFVPAARALPAGFAVGSTLLEPRIDPRWVPSGAMDLLQWATGPPASYVG